MIPLEELMYRIKTDVGQAKMFVQGRCFCGGDSKNPFLVAPSYKMSGFFLFCDNCCENYYKYKFLKKLTSKEHFVVKIFYDQSC